MILYLLHIMEHQVPTSPWIRFSTCVLIQSFINNFLIQWRSLMGFFTSSHALARPYVIFINRVLESFALFQLIPPSDPPVEIVLRVKAMEESGSLTTVL